MSDHGAHGLRPWLGDPVVAGLLAAGLLLHGVLALGFHLSPDEAQYALYAAHPDWSYYDHPPLVGWLQWPALMAGGQDLLMRIVPMAAWALTAMALLGLTARLVPAPDGLAVARWATAVLVLSPLPHLLAVALVPDSLLTPLTVLAMTLTWRLCQPDGPRDGRLWAGIGLCLGLAGLSKYTAVLLALGALIALLLAHGPRVLGRPGPWVASALALLLVTPVLAWNAAHDWISFTYQLGHGAGSGGGEWKARRVLSYAAVQVLAYGPLLAVGALALWRASPAPAAGAGPQVAGPARGPLSPLALCACFALPPLVLFAALSGRGTTLPHWSNPAWTALIPAAALGCHALWPRWRRALGVGLGLQALSCLAVAALMLRGGVGEEAGAQATRPAGLGRESAPLNPVADLYGWDLAARQGRALAEARGLKTLAVMNWSLASRLAWYARPMAVQVIPRHPDQMELWFGTVQPGESVLLLDWSLMATAPPVGPAQFERCEPVGQLPVFKGERQLAHFSYLHCIHWQGPAEQALGRRHRP
jgi:4-amino-4-deoxy-L-arabinose transferase-like glycosyltransferase